MILEIKLNTFKKPTRDETHKQRTQVSRKTDYQNKIGRAHV